MIGTKKLTKKSRKEYLYSGSGGAVCAPVVQPPTGGSYIRAQIGAGASGTIIITGVYNSQAVSETITSFDSLGVGFGSQRFSSITNFNISLSTGTVVIYPATQSGEIIRLSSFTESTIFCDWSYSSGATGHQVMIDVSGRLVPSEVELFYDSRYTLYVGDIIVINSKNYEVAKIEDSGDETRIAYLVNTGG
jgi:hypothetical protein